MPILQKYITFAPSSIIIMRKAILIIIVCLLVALFATCPGEEAHKNAFYTEISSSDNGDLNSLFALIVGNNAKAWEAALRLGGYGFQVKNYYLVSLGYLNSADGSACCTIGALGHVWVSTEDGFVMH